MEPYTIATYGGLEFECGLDGQIADSNPTSIVNLHYVSPTNQMVSYGRAVVRGEGRDLCRLPSSTKDSVAGIVLRSFHGQGYDSHTCISVLKSGFVWVSVGEDVTQGDTASVFTQEDKAGFLGSSGRDGAAPKSGHIALKAAIWETSAVRGQKAKLRINL